MTLIGTEMELDLGKLYDGLASSYDRDEYRLLGTARDAGLAQIAQHVAARQPMSVVDLGAGTGESLRVLHERFPGASLCGVDVSAQMLAVAAQKLPLRAVVASAEHVAQHVPAASADLMLMHFITTFVDVPATLRACCQVLRPGGYLSIVSTTLGAFPRLLAEVGLKIATWEEIVAAGPAPADAASLAQMARDAGLEVVQVQEVTRDVVFPSTQACFEFGRSSGFFTHLIEALGEERILAREALVAPAFPLADRYLAAAILVRRPEGRV